MASLASIAFSSVSRVAALRRSARDRRLRSRYANPPAAAPIDSATKSLMGPLFARTIHDRSRARSRYIEADDRSEGECERCATMARGASLDLSHGCHRAAADGRRRCTRARSAGKTAWLGALEPSVGDLA